MSKKPRVRRARAPKSADRAAGAGRPVMLAVALAAALASAAAVAWFVTLPAYRTFVEKNELLSEARSEYQAVKRELEGRAGPPELDQRYAWSEAAWIDPEAVSETGADLERLIRESGLEPAGIELGPPRAADPGALAALAPDPARGDALLAAVELFSTATATARVSGPFGGLPALIIRIERDPRLIILDSVDIRAAEDDGGVEAWLRFSLWLSRPAHSDVAALIAPPPQTDPLMSRIMDERKPALGAPMAVGRVSPLAPAPPVQVEKPPTEVASPRPAARPAPRPAPRPAAPKTADPGAPRVVIEPAPAYPGFEPRVRIIGPGMIEQPEPGPEPSPEPDPAIRVTGVMVVQGVPRIVVKLDEKAFHPMLGESFADGYLFYDLVDYAALIRRPDGSVVSVKTP